MFVHMWGCVRESGIEWENLLFPSLVSVKTTVEGSVAGDAYMCPCVCVCVSVYAHTHARQCQCEHVQSVCAVVFVRYCPPTGYLYREHDIKRDR